MALRRSAGVNIPDNDPPVLTVTGGKANATGTGWSGTVTLSFSENLYWLSEDRQTLKEVWTKAPATPAEKKKAVYILDEAFGIGGSAAKKLKLASGALASPSGTFTFSYEGVVEGDTLVFFTTGYASDMNMNGRGMEAKTKNNPDLCDRGRRHRAVPDKRTFCHYARCD